MAIHDNGMIASLARLCGFSSSVPDTVSGRVTIRNLTSEALTVEQVQRLTDQRLDQAAKQEALQLRLPAFTTSPSSLQSFAKHHSELLQFNFRDGSSTRHDISLSNAKAVGRQGPRATDEDPYLTTIYDPSSRFLTLLETPRLTCWMRDFHDQTSLAALSIPGTHNSPTYHWALPSVRCQAVSPVEQLRNGVRFFDVRVQPGRPQDASDETLHLVHGAFPISLTGSKSLRSLINDIDSFLTANPSETLIISIKREGIGKATDEQLADIITTHYAKGWYTEPQVPTLGQVRGKVVLMRRFRLSERLKSEHGGRGYGLDAESWEDNTASCVHGQVCVQDFYQVMTTKTIPTKIDVSCAQFERSATVVCPVPGSDVQATQDAPQQIYLNFLTASNFFNFRCWPENIAAKLNPAIIRFLCEKHEIGDHGADGPGQSFVGDGGLGIVVCDWVGKHGDWDLVKCIVGMNSRRLYRERGYGWRQAVVNAA